MEYKLINIIRQDPNWPELVLNRPDKANAFNEAMIAEITHALEYFHQNLPRGLIVSAHGKHFSAGADLEYMERLANAGYDENLADAKKLAQMFKAFAQFPAPIIVKANGCVMGGAVAILATADIVVASSDIEICFSEAKWGLIPATIAPYIIALLGPKRSQYYFTSAQIIKIDEALQIGLLTESTDQLEETAEAYKKTFNNLSPHSINMIKKMMYEYNDESVYSKINGAKLIADIRQMPHAKDGLACFKNKTLPPWIL